MSVFARRPGRKRDNRSATTMCWKLLFRVFCVWLAAGLCGCNSARRAADSETARTRQPTAAASASAECDRRNGGIVRGPRTEKNIALQFTGHQFAEGGQEILNQLARHHGKASFFFTGQFLTNAEFCDLIRRIISDGHYLGPHSDQHLLYCSWDAANTTLLTREQFESDLESNLLKLERLGVERPQLRCFVPPYEHYNSEIASWTRDLGLTLINYTPGTRSNADYTGEGDRNFVSTQAIFDSILARESQDANGLNGFLLLLHIGSGPARADKFHARFGELLDRLTEKGYRFVRIDQLLKGAELSPPEK